ncbi:unnamed protein product [Acanthoscelides obtectus]|uniref:Uncharacterized protein n=1 Tax=Acanthoscelides obtectus TaxID=200917 RepID=A0A9P0PRE5_ACAOB|nr:unnamed protein product [Acanthoscelides obtectus]CAK1631696.1 hypothetical protein AOBTE_LOCUS7103 [Acanthoscelides obtectus]
MNKISEDECNEECKKVLEERMNRTKLLRNFFQKQKCDPFRHMKNEAGAVAVSKVEER